MAARNSKCARRNYSAASSNVTHVNSCPHLLKVLDWRPSIPVQVNGSGDYETGKMVMRQSKEI
jgi:hypothetical protein